MNQTQFGFLLCHRTVHTCTEGYLTITGSALWKNYSSVKMLWHVYYA